MDTKGQHDDEQLDETLEETFPASDAPSNTVETGIRTETPFRLRSSTCLTIGRSAASN
jgi:hypothetical protein